MFLNGISQNKPDDEPYFIVDVPLRITPTELARLQAVSSNPSPEPTNVHPFVAMESKVATARARALDILAVRQRRETVLGTDLFGEPAWDLMLDLFVRYVDRQKTSSTSAAIAARAPPTTALRYLTILVQKGLVVRETSDHDLRLQYVELSDHAYRDMLALLSNGH
jgi:hypothetical protein